MKTAKNNIKNDDFFDYLSEIEMNSISPADELELNDLIDKRVSNQNLKRNANTFSIALVLSFTCLLFFMLFTKKTVLQIGVQTNGLKNSGGDLLVEAIHQDTSLITDSNNIVNAVSKEFVRSVEHFVKENSDKHFLEDLKAMDLPSKEISLVDSSQTPIGSENYLKLLPNASVIYIYDLKITEFQKLYFKKMKPFVLEVSSLSAQFENTDAYKSYTMEHRSSGEYTLDMLLKDALKLFNKKNFKQAFILFDELLNYNENDVNALFYAGLCEYNLGEEENAILHFNKVLSNENNVFNQESDWYKALSLIKLHKDAEAIPLLIKINSQNGFYSSSAGNKLKEISSTRH